MKKITRTIKTYYCNVIIYAYDSQKIETVNDTVYEMSKKEAVKHFEKKYNSIGKVVDVLLVKSEDIKVSLDIETFVSMATVTPAVNDSPEMPEPIVDSEPVVESE